ncbi:glycosyltransferase family 1 protein [Ferrimicrobium sp.]|uniref:glycosyltransferase family 4 protein n=1 Tax=Ferrimicrobium sp. TaxID=2926050 RepID=UPI0026197AC9|nr:glycosyltransferase family 1 protein [Ferrimicrobium sp.]
MTKPGLLLVDQLTRRVSGGIGVYISGVLQGLNQIGMDRDLTLFTSHTTTRVGPSSWVGTRVQTRLDYRLQQRLWDYGAGAPKGNWSFYHAFSLGGPLLRMNMPCVVAVYDLLFRSEGETFPSRARAWHERRFAQVVASNARVVTLAAETVKLLVEAGVSAERIVVIPPGVDHVPPADTVATAKLLDNLGIVGRYLMVLGTIEPRKNLQRILQAYQHYRATSFDPVPLVIVGPKGWGPDIVPPRGAFMVGSLPGEVVSGLLARALALVYVPLQEGFGLPVIEALAAAVPVITTANIPAARFGGLGVEPRDVDAIAQAIDQIANDDPLRSRLVTHGLLAVDGLSWVVAAEQHVRLWEELTE